MPFIIETNKTHKQRMNKIRIIRIVMLAVGIIFHFTLKPEATDFLTGIAMGIGIGLLLTGRIGKSGQ